MKKIISSIIAVVMLFNIMLTTAVYAVEAENAVSVHNGIVQYNVNNETGRFTIHTADGLPNKASDNDKNLLFLHDTPETSFTTFRIDGKDYIFGNSYGFLGSEGGIVSKPVVDGNITTTVWKVKGVEVTQKLQLIVDASNPNVGNTKITYSVVNAGDHKVEVGSRIMLDTQLGTNDASPMLVGTTYITNETEYEGEGVPAAWKSADEKFAPGVISYGLLSGFDNVAPSRMVIAHWESLSKTKWDYTPNSLINFTTDKNEYGSADSAVALYYEPQPVEVGDEIVFETFYGIGSLSDTYNDGNFNFQVNAPNKLTVNSTGTSYNEETFTVVVTIDNNHVEAEPIENAKIALGISEQLAFAPNQTSEQYVSYIAAGETYSASFELVPTVCNNVTVAEVGATINYSDKYSEARKSIVLPSVKGTPPDMQMTEISPKKVYTKTQKKVLVVKGSDFDSLKADYEWTMFIKGRNSGVSHQIMRKDISITNDTLTVAIDKSYEFVADTYDLIIYSSAYGNMSKSVEFTSDSRYDRKSYGTLLIGGFEENEDGDVVYDVKVLEKEEEYANLPEDVKEKVLLTLRGEIFEYELDGQVQYDCGDGTIINNAILYSAPTAEPHKCFTIKRQNKGGVDWWGKVEDSLTLSGDGFLTIGDFTFHYGNFYVVLNDGEEYELAEPTDAEGGDDDYNWDTPFEGEASSVEIITPANVVASQVLKTVGLLSGTNIQVSNAVIGSNTVSLGGSISVGLPWLAKEKEDKKEDGDKDKNDKEEEKKSPLEERYDKNDSLNSIEEGKKSDDIVALNLEELRYGVNKSNSAYLVGLKADGNINLTSDSIPKLDAGGAFAGFALNSLDYDGMYAAINAGFKVGDAFECEGTVALVFETGGKCIPDSVELVMGGDVFRIPLGAGPLCVGYLTKMGGGVYNLYDTIKGYFNVIPPLTLKLITGYADPTIYSFELDTIALEFGLNGFEFTAEEGKLFGLKVLDESYAKFLVYATKYDGKMYPCVDIGMGTSMSILGIIKGEGSIWLVADPRIDSVFGNVSLGGKAYIGLVIPDYIPVIGGKEIASAMAELSTYRAYMGIRVIGIPFSVGYYWADKKVKFNDDFALLAQQLYIPEEEYENALDVIYAPTETNTDGLMVFGGNMREIYSSRKDGVNLLALNNEHNITLSNQDYALFDLTYTGEKPNVTVKRPDGSVYDLVEDENLLYQTIDAEHSESGQVENHIYISVTDPENGTWKIESDKAVDCRGMDVLALPEIKNVEAQQLSDGKIKVNWDALNIGEGYTVDIHMSEKQKVVSLTDVENAEEYNKQMAAGYDPGLKVLSDIPASDKTAEFEIPERLLGGEYQVRVVLKKGLENYASEMSAETFTYVNPNEPSMPENIQVSLGGDGQFKVEYDEAPNAQGYVVTVLDENGDALEGFEGLMTDKTKVYVGNKASVVTGYDDEGNPTGFKEAGVVPGKSYRVMVYAYNEQEYVTYTSQKYISEPIYLPEPDPAEVTLKLNDITATVADSVNEKTVGATTNKPESVIYYISDQDVDVAYFVDEKTDEQIYHVQANVPYEFPVTLTEGSNVIEFMAVNENNDYTISKLIATLDSTAPELLLNETTVLSVNGQYELVGTAEPNAKVFVGEDGVAVPVIDGSFSYMGTQVSTRDEVTVRAVDIAGNETVMTAEVIPSELSDFTKIKIKHNSSDVELIELYQGETAILEVYGVDASGAEFALDNDNVKYDVIYGSDKASVDEDGVITANYYGEAIVLCSYNVSDSYSFEETVNVAISQAYEDAKDIRISTTEIKDNYAGALVANLSIPDAPVGVTYTYTIADNEYFDIAGNSVMLKKAIDTQSAQFTVTAQGKHVLDGVYSDIGTPITKTFTMKPVLNITAVEEVDSISVYVGTQFEDLKLPEKLDVTLSDGSVVECSIDWAQNAYNPDVVATYILKGKIRKPENVTNTDDIYAKTSVTLSKRSTSSGRKNSSKTISKDVVVKYEGETLVVVAEENKTAVTLTDEILSNETNNLKVVFDNVSVTLDNETVDKIRNNQSKVVSATVKDNKLSISVGGIKNVKGVVSYTPENIDGLTEGNTVVVRNGKVIANSYFDGENVVFVFNEDGDYTIETRTSSFDDVKEGWAKDYISFLAVRDKINGMGNNQFEPERNVTRAEFLKMIFSALDIEIADSDVTASDVKASDWFAPYVGFAMENGIVKGYEDGTFKPNNQISRQEMMVMLHRCLEFKGIKTKEGKLTFSDKADVAAWAKDSVTNIVALGLITGFEDGTLKPHWQTRRSECAVVMTRCIKMITDSMIK
ncbi:MAG: S-layer homology domain-containing protein [Clostridia bacterium]|nr:S-layer homology domain-containing protein [Clostridia bacterium]